jgi:hypothetical protein
MTINPHRRAERKEQKTLAKIPPLKLNLDFIPSTKNSF